MSIIINKQVIEIKWSFYIPDFFISGSDFFSSNVSDIMFDKPETYTNSKTHNY